MTFIFDGKIRRKLNFNKVDWQGFYAFEAYSVKIGIRSDDAEVLRIFKERLPKLLPTGYREIEFEEAEFVFSIRYAPNTRNKILVYKNDKELLRLLKKDWKIDLLESHIRITIAEFATDYVFLHAGAVSFKGSAIIIPAKSFSGKTTLVAELAGRGLEYYSDEYAVIDKDGFLHPFPKQLSMRGIINDHEQVDIDVEEYGGKKGSKPISIGLILVSKYIKRAKFQPKILSSGEGIIESIANSVSIRQNPEFVLKVLGIVMNQAKVVKTNRSEAKQFADKFLPFVEDLGI
ncbi:MAG: hypothetical protein AAB336_06110 [Acidobacteriota bacterium]